MTVEGEPAVKVSFAESEIVEERTCEGILDSSFLGDVVGIEILFLREQLKASPPKDSRTGLPRWSHDPEVDAFYVHLSEGRAQEQSKVTVRAGIDARGAIVQLSVP
jgi:uncharacterized protein YuzE